MYAVKSYMNFYEGIHPANILYPMRSYHNGSLTNGMLEVKRGNLEEIIKERQLKLIEELTTFIIRLNKILINKDPHSSSGRQFQTVKWGNACAKVPLKQFTYRKSDDASLRIISNKLGTKCSPKVTTFKPIAKYPSYITLAVTEDVDRKCLRNIAVTGAEGFVAFEGLDGCFKGVAPCTVKVITMSSDNAKSVMAKIDDMEISGRVIIWKLLGALLTTYPAPSEHADICIHMDRWLILIDDFISGFIDEDNLCRQMNVALSRYDYLIPNFGATLADILAYSVITRQSYVANNVELWLRRMDQLFQE